MRITLIKFLRSLFSHDDTNADLEQARLEADHLQRLASSLARADSLHEMAEVVATECRAAVRADAVSVHLLQDDGYFEMVSSLGCTQAYIEQWRRVPKTMVPIANVPCPEEAHFIGSSAQFRAEIPAASKLIEKSRRHTIAYAPLVVNGKTSGIFGYSYNTPPTHQMSRSFVLTLVAICAQALERARLVDYERRARREADIANTAKTQFLASISHEIRSPLCVIEGFADLLSESDTLSLHHRQWARHIQRNSRQLLRIIGDVLDISKIEAEKIECEKISMSLTDLLADVETAMRPAAMDKGITLLFHQKNLPALILSDPTRLRQVLLNVIGNAIKFTLAGRVTVKAIYSEGQGLVVEIRDTGIGIPFSQQQRVFEPFVQGDLSTSRRFGGSGLGLSISKKLANALGGDLVLKESNPGFGSRFLFTLNCEPLQAEVPCTSPVTCGKQELTGMRVLLVEDSLDNQELIRQLLIHAGAAVDVAGTGMAGIRMAMNHEYNVVLMDIQMPELDGFQTVSLLRSKGYKRPIAALTAHALSSEKDRAAGRGFDEYLTKPIDRPALIESLKRLSH